MYLQPKWSADLYIRERRKVVVLLLLFLGPKPTRLTVCHVWRLWPSWKLSGFCFLAERVSPMDVGGEPWSALSAEGLLILREGIFLVLSCWWGIQWCYRITPWPYTNSAMILSPGSPSPKVPFLGLKMSSSFFFSYWLALYGWN